MTDIRLPGDADPAEFQFQLGRLLIGLPATSAFARHTDPFSTLKDYVHAEGLGSAEARLAAEYLKDVATLSTAGMLEKWFHLSQQAAAAEMTRRLDAETC